MQKRLLAYQSHVHTPSLLTLRNSVNIATSARCYANLEEWPLPLGREDELLADLRAWVAEVGSQPKLLHPRDSLPAYWCHTIVMLKALLGDPVVETSLSGVPSWQQVSDKKEWVANAFLYGCGSKQTDSMPI
eukprot:3257417-Amphidinium_carterae.2